MSGEFLAIPKQALYHKDGYIIHIPGYCLAEESSNFYVLIKDFIFNAQYEHLEGQINRNTQFGELLYKTAINPNFTKWLEIGTWNGKGTTTCILDGFRDAKKSDSKLISYEANKDMYEMAKRNLKSHEFFNSVIFCSGRITNKKEFTKVFELSDITRNSDFFKRFYDAEKNLYTEATQIEPLFSPHVVVLDGAEYTGMLDFESIPKDDLKIIFLDDVNCDKNKKVVELLKGNLDWILFKKDDERNGWACFLHKDLMG